MFRKKKIHPDVLSDDLNVAFLSSIYSSLEDDQKAALARLFVDGKHLLSPVGREFLCRSPDLVALCQSFDPDFFV